MHVFYYHTISMKKIILALFVVLFTNSVLANYSPSDDDLATVSNLKTQLMQIVWDNNKDLRSFYYQVKVLKKNYSFDERLDFMLWELLNHLRSKLQTKKQTAKVLSHTNKQEFLDKYLPNVLSWWAVLDSCIGWYNTLDNIAFAYNYPTALLISSWYRESNCGYYLPRNGDGPFQIVSKDYGTWEITEEIFVQSVVDYIEFAENKYDRYSRANSTSWLTVELSYTGLSLTWIVRHGALYNWLSGYTVYGDAKPLHPWYVWDRYTDAFSGATRYGLLPQTLRILEWELEFDH